jgi:acyl transferase domain-containing protein
MYLGLSRAHFLSPTGQCKPFDIAADGYCRAEGCGLVVLKKLSQAVKEGDHIYGVIRGIAVNQCGTAKSITHPDHITQAELFKKVLRLSRVKPQSISVVEAHGTGTQAGDYAEIQSLQSTFGRSRAPSNPLYLTSLKGNIGHSEAASGLAGLTKLLLMLDRNKIPPQAAFRELNPRLATIADHNIVIPTEVIDWKTASSKAPRRALLNNFGAAGSNAALVLEEYRTQHHRSARLELQAPMRSAHVLNIAAKGAAALEELRRSYTAYMDSNPDIRIEDLCYTANARRREEDYHAHRLSVVGSTVGELAAQLGQAKSLARQATRGQDPRKIVFVFSGQGGIYPDMGSELLSTSPEFKKTVEMCDNILTRNGYPPTTNFLANNGPWSNKDRIVVEQCACFVVEYALAKLLMTWGLVPDVVMGHRYAFPPGKRNTC